MSAPVNIYTETEIFKLILTSLCQTTFKSSSRLPRVSSYSSVHKDLSESGSLTSHPSPLPTKRSYLHNNRTLTTSPIVPGSGLVRFKAMERKQRKSKRVKKKNTLSDDCVYIRFEQSSNKVQTGNDRVDTHTSLPHCEPQRR